MRAAFRVLWCAVVLLPAVALAQEEQDERVEQPLQSFHFSDPAYLQDPQALQVAAGLRWSGEEQGNDNFTVPVQLQYGANERFEFGAEVTLAFPRPLTGTLRSVERAEATVMMRFIDDRAHGVALSAGVGFLGSRDVLDNTFDPGGVPHVRAFAQRGVLLANVDLSVDLVARRDLDAVPRGALGAALDFGMLQPVLEAVYENDEAPTGIFALGLRFHPFESLELGAAVPLQVSEGQTNVGVTGQVVWSVGG